MRGFSPVVLVLTSAMHNGRKNLPMGSRITPMLVGDQLPGCLSLMFQGPTKEALSGSTISTLGDQNIDHVSILIDGSPKIAALTLDGDEEFIDVPNVAESSLFSTKISGVAGAKLLTPVPDRFIRDDDTPFH